MNKSTENVSCYWCTAQISSGAKVCSECGRHQGLIGHFSSIGIVSGVAVSLLGAAISVSSFIQSSNERIKAEQALKEAESAMQQARVAHSDFLKYRIEELDREVYSIEYSYRKITCHNKDEFECVLYLEQLKEISRDLILHIIKIENVDQGLAKSLSLQTCRNVETLFSSWSSVTKDSYDEFFTSQALRDADYRLAEIQATESLSDAELKELRVLLSKFRKEISSTKIYFFENCNTTPKT